MLVKLLALCASLFSVNANVASDAPHPNVIIMHVNKLVIKLGWMERIEFNPQTHLL